MLLLQNIFWLGTKELRSFFRDYVFFGFVVFSFSFSIYSQAQSNSQELFAAALGIVDEDHSELSRSIAAAFLPPYFKPPQLLSLRDVDRLMDAGKYTFILDIPPNFQRDVEGGRQPTIQVNIDATAMVQAGLGSGYSQTIIAAGDRQIRLWLGRRACARRQSRCPHDVQSEWHGELVHGAHGHRQQCNDAGDHIIGRGHHS